MQWYLLCCGYAGSSLEARIETDSNDITVCAHHDHTYAAMSVVSDARVSTHGNAFGHVCLSVFVCL